MAKGRTKRVKIKRVAPPPAPAFEATPERLAQAGPHLSLVKGTIEKAGERVALVRRFSDSYIDRLLRTKKLTFAQWYAADWYREIYQLTGIEARTTANYGGSGAGECSYGMAMTERQARARQRLRAARETFPPNMAGLIDRVVLHDMAPALQGGAQRARFAAHLGRSLQPLAEWINAPEHP